jgi:glycosyltransferase involved in cell wall biosynthesis
MDSDVAVLQTDLIRPNGAELVSMMQARELDADLWALRYDENVFPDIAEDIDIYEYGVSLPLDFPLSTTFNTIAPAFADPSFLKDYDAVIAHKDLSEILAYRAKKKYGTNFIWYMHNTSDLLYRSGGMPLPIQAISKTLGSYLRRTDRNAFESADKVFTNSIKTKNQLLEKDIGVDTKVEVLYPPVRELPISSKQESYAVALSRISPDKNLERALEEMENRPEKLKIGGSVLDENYKRKLEKVAETKGIELEFEGYIPDEELGIFLSEAKFGIYPSNTETFGLVPMEMMKVGTPCFVLEGSGVAEILPSSYHLPIQKIPKTTEKIHSNQKHYTTLLESVKS